jgi:hypothetical protein
LLRPPTALATLACNTKALCNDKRIVGPIKRVRPRWFGNSKHSGQARQIVGNALRLDLDHELIGKNGGKWPESGLQ